MMSLRLGVVCAVLDDRERILLSCRGDFKVWALPGGRLNAGERLSDAAMREVREETGLIVQIERPVGLYFMPAFQRMNVLYEVWSLGGELLQKTDETRENRYFPRYDLPEMPLTTITLDAFGETRPPPRMIETPPSEVRRLRWKLRQRWLWNRLRGKPEPKWPHFEINAVAVIYDISFRRVLAVANDVSHTLPRVVCDGSQAPWQQLGEAMRDCYGISPVLHWVGLWQDVMQNTLEFVFAATIDERQLSHNAKWTTITNAPLMGRDLDYMRRVAPDYQHGNVWSLAPDIEEIEHDERIRKSLE